MLAEYRIADKLSKENSMDFKNFVSALLDKGVKVTILDSTGSRFVNGCVADLLLSSVIKNNQNCRIFRGVSGCSDVERLDTLPEIERYIKEAPKNAEGDTSRILIANPNLWGKLNNSYEIPHRPFDGFNGSLTDYKERFSWKFIESTDIKNEITPKEFSSVKPNEITSKK